MKKSKSEILVLVLVLIVIILSIILVGIKVTNYVNRINGYEKTNVNKIYLEKRNKTNHKPSNLKEVEANDLNIKNVDTYLNNIHFNGSVTILKNGQLMLDKGWGCQNIKSGKKNSPNTMYLIGSAQKFATGLILKKLEIEHKININDDVTKYLPWFKTSEPITLKDLMLHRSGLYKFKANPKTKSLNGAVHDIQHKGINDQYYHKHFYNDANYLVLAQVIEVVTHKSYTQNYYERIGQPYKLEHSAFFNEKAYKHNMATGYKVVKNKIKRTKPNILDQYYGAGNLYMTTHDMVKLVNHLQHNKIFKQSITTPLLQVFGSTAYPEAYRYGFYVTPQYDRINGVFFGQTFTVYFNQQYVVVVASNKVDRSKGSNEKVISYIYHHLLGQHVYINY
ncbi:beta-lactamase family protein [Staphylococcus caledonicus]|uniref:serine hydrolase domain-containing protein n=1 Tax=Staphylococcus sp. acrmy TaxID=2929076 RepID=UPI001F5A6333|nr:serine hydrolase domain-containing protein [Staphylococcus sp. acrmy]MCI2947394.1 beta-lactamase family protein [Staphylococcus sp. acrmy]